MTMMPPQGAFDLRACALGHVLLPLLVVATSVCGCRQESWDPGPYRFCETEAQCRSNEACIHVRSTSDDGGTTLSGVCSTSCTVSSIADGVYSVAGARAPVCVGIDGAGQVDTTMLDVPGWLLVACGNDHLMVGETDYRIVCTPFDYAGYPIDLWIPVPVDSSPP